MDTLKVSFNILLERRFLGHVAQVFVVANLCILHKFLYRYLFASFSFLQINDDADKWDNKCSSLKDLLRYFFTQGAITSKIKHAIKLETSPARLAQLLQPVLAVCFSLQPMTA